MGCEVVASPMDGTSVFPAPPLPSGPILLPSPPRGAPAPSPGTTRGSLGKINDFMKLPMLFEPVSGMQKMQSGPGAGPVMAGDGGMEPVGTGGTRSAPHWRWELPGAPPNPLPPLGGLRRWVSRRRMAASRARRHAAGPELRLPGGNFNYASKYQLIMNRLLHCQERGF